MSGELLACDGQRSIGRVSLAHQEFLGTDVREKERALAVLWEQVSEDRLAPLLRHELAPYLPVAER
jgi:predicted Zn-dependent protease